MPTVRPRLCLLLAALAAAPVHAQAVNPLGGDTLAPQERAAGAVPAPAQSRGKLEPDAASGGVVFTDEAGWYRFVMANGGTTSRDGAMRIFQFESGGQKAACLTISMANNAFAKFTMEQIQAELDTLYAPFDAAVTANNGTTILERRSLTLDATGQRNAAPLRVLAWDTRDKDGNLLTYTLAPLPAGQLLFACGVGSASHAREIIQRYLRIAEGGLVPAK